MCRNKWSARGESSRHAHHAEYPTKNTETSILYLYAIVMVAAVGGFLFGYDLSLISGAIVFLKEEFALSSFDSRPPARSQRKIQRKSTCHAQSAPR